VAATSEAEAREILCLPAPYVSVTAQGIVIAAGYSGALERLLRWVPKAAWRQDMRAWLVPLAGADAVRSVLPEIQRLAEAAADERQAERAGSDNGQVIPTKETFDALAKALDFSTADLAALAQALSSLDPNRIDALVLKLRGIADQLEALRKKAQ
jgi:hypothetical protein